MEDFIEQIDFALAHLLLRTSTYRPNGSDRLPKPKTLLILWSSTCVLSPVPPSAAKWSPRFTGKSRLPFAANASRQPAAVRGQRKPLASRHSRPTQAASQPPFAAHRSPRSARRSRPPFAAYASLPAPAPELLDTALPPEFSVPLLTPEPAPRQRTPEPAQ